MGEEALPDADRPHEQGRVRGGRELQRAGGVEEPAVEADLCRPVEVLEPADPAPKPAWRRRSSRRPWSRRLTSSPRMICREVSVVEPLAAGEAMRSGRGVEHPRFRALAGLSTTRDNDTYRARRMAWSRPAGPPRPTARRHHRRAEPTASGCRGRLPRGAVRAAGDERAIVPAELSEQAKEAIGRAIAASRSPNTRRSYRVAWRAWEAWARSRGYLPMPAGAETVAEYLTERAAAGAGASTLGMASLRSPPTAQPARPTRPAARGVRRTAAGSGGSPPAAHNGRPGRSPRRPWPPSRRVPRPRRAGARNWRSAGRCATHCSAVRRRPRSPGPASSVPTTARGAHHPPREGRPGGQRRGRLHRDRGAGRA